MEQLMEYWQQRDRREQVILAIGGVFVALVLVWMLLFKPVMQWRSQQQSIVDGQARTLAQVQTLAAEMKLQQQNSNNTKGDGSLAQIVDSSLRDNSLRMKGFQPGRNGEARLRLENATYEPLMQWLYDLEYRHGVHVLEMSLARTQIVGVVTVNLRLRKP